MTPAPTYAQMFRVFGRIGVLSFGGPAAQIALMHRELVQERPWLDEETYLRALSLCMLLPGPEAMQLATYAGWRLRGVRGGLLAGGLFVLPGALIIAALVAVYVSYGQLPLVAAAFQGVQATVIIIVLQALRAMAGRTLKSADSWIIAGLSFVGIYALNLPFPLLIALAALWGYVTAKPDPSPAKTQALPPLKNSLRILALWLPLWLLPLALLGPLGAPFLAQIGGFFAWLAVVTFGGAYAVLAYMTQTIVSGFGWIETAQMIDALGLAETTPGPLILVTQFVAMLSGYLQDGAAQAVAAGLVALWATFIPCFLWIFLAGPYLEHLASRPRLSAALSRVTAAVVGVILNLSLWFALHVLFGTVGALPLRPLSLPWPEIATLDLRALILTGLAAGLIFGLRLGLLPVLGLMALCAMAATAI